MLMKDPENTKQIERSVRILAGTIPAGVLASAFYAFQCANILKWASVFAVASMIGVASLISGALLGFLFGIPRALQQDTVEEPSETEQVGLEKKGKPPKIAYRVNTNLEQISDWLTKILVGVGLTQISEVPSALRKYAEFTSVGLGGFPNSGTFSIGLLLYFLVCGFLIGYLWTRLHLAGAFRQADIAAIGGKLARVESKVSQFEEQTVNDAKALSIVQRQIKAERDAPTISEEVINDAIKKASPTVRAQIFYLAQGVRRENWENPQTKYKMERTIPIFRALIMSDTENVFHANHGQLGFALKDKRQPDWVEAEAELTKAIEIRGSWKDQGWLFYEFNRAVCRIERDAAFKSDNPSDDTIKRIILDDLRTAANAPMLVDIIMRDTTIKKWMDLNNITKVKLKP
jgi:hypothetical protein